MLAFQVYTKGIMVSDFLVRSSSQQGDEQFPISFLVEDAMAPNARLLVFYFRPDKEVVADSISFKVKGSSDNPVSRKHFNQMYTLMFKRVKKKMKWNLKKCTRVLVCKSTKLRHLKVCISCIVSIVYVFFHLTCPKQVLCFCSFRFRLNILIRR